jgi:hypothetical protein
MPFQPNPREWELPLGFVGIGAMAIVGGIAFTLGEFSVYGLQFLPYWHLIAGWTAGLTALAAAFGTFLECLIWNGRMVRTSRFLPSWPSGRRAALAVGILVVVVGAYAYAHQQCTLFRVPVLSIIGFGVVVALQEPILLALREAGRPPVALAVMLVLEAGLLFAIGERMAIDHYDKGLKHFQNENRGYWSISTTGSADFYMDYARSEIVLRAQTSAGTLDIRRPFADLACR